MDWIRDPIWQFIGVILAIIAIIVAMKQQGRKSITYDVLADSSLLSGYAHQENNLQLIYQGKSINEARLIVLKIYNSGTIPISSKDYETPIEIDFGLESEILDAQVVYTEPSGIPVQISNNVNFLKVTPSLLNKGDTIIIKILLMKSQQSILVRGRILGVKQINRYIDRMTFEMPGFVGDTFDYINASIVAVLLILLILMTIRTGIDNIFIYIFILLIFTSSILGLNCIRPIYWSLVSYIGKAATILIVNIVFISIFVITFIIMNLMFELNFL